MSTTNHAKPVMSSAQFARLARIIYDRAGIHFPETKKYILESRLGTRLDELELDNFDQYACFLTMGPYQAEEFQEMFNRITINETSFFRNEPQLEVFETQVLPELLEARRQTKRLRIWCAACSSGEEPYTLAILIHRTLGLRLLDWRVEILGTDISEQALSSALAGRYTDYALRSTPALVKQRYFKHEDAHWSVDQTLRSMTSFQVHNLKDRMGARRFGHFDAIFCRNVLIYFDEPMRQKVIDILADQLRDDGTLFIGHSETLRGLKTPFQQLGIPHGFCYRIAPESTPAPTAPPAFNARANQGAQP